MRVPFHSLNDIPAMVIFGQRLYSDNGYSHPTPALVLCRCLLRGDCSLLPEAYSYLRFLSAELPISIDHCSSASSYRKSRRSRKDTRSNFRRMVDTANINPQNQSEVLIVRGGAKSAGAILRVEGMQSMLVTSEVNNKEKASL